jgi:hypothetical protein
MAGVHVRASPLVGCFPGWLFAVGNLSDLSLR